MACTDPTPDAVIRLQRLRDNSDAAMHAMPNVAPIRTTTGRTLCTTRARAAIRDVHATSGSDAMGGVMGYVALDVANLKRWLAGTSARLG